MKRDQTIARAIASAVILAPAMAQASEDGLVLLPDPKMLLLLIVIFSAMVIPVNALILKPIFRVLDERTEQIGGTRRRAEKLSAEAEEVLARYEQAIRGARQSAEGDRKQTLEEARTEGAGTAGAARSEAESEVQRAREEMGAALSEARTALRSQSQELAREVASRALGRALS